MKNERDQATEKELDDLYAMRQASRIQPLPLHLRRREDRKRKKGGVKR